MGDIRDGVGKEKAPPFLEGVAVSSSGLKVTREVEAPGVADRSRSSEALTFRSMTSFLTLGLETNAFELRPMPSPTLLNIGEDLPELSPKRDGLPGRTIEFEGGMHRKCVIFAVVFCITL